MAHLLGRQDCVDSLRKDLIDLQGSVLDVFSRTGPVRFPSWKFPDKLSCNLDLVSLLDKFDFIDGEDELNQYAHIVLLELVIDRLLLLLQSFNVYAEQMRIGQRRQQSQQTNPCVSIGLVVRHYWNNLVKLGNVQPIIKESPNVTNAAKHKETNYSPAPSVTGSSLDLGPQPSFSRKTESAHFISMPQNQINGISSCATYRSVNNIPHSPTLISSDTRSMRCQTVQSCLVPCDACARVQSSLRETGDALVELCKSEGLPSSLQCLLVAVDDTLGQGRLTAGELAQWSTEQQRDMGRLGKHLLEVRATVQPLRDGLRAAEEERKRSNAQLERAQEEMQQERKKHEASTQQLQQRLQKVQTSWLETEKKLLEEQELLRRGTVSLEDSYSKLKADISLQQERIHLLELENNELQKEVKSMQEQEEKLRKLEERTQMLEAQLSSTQLLLDKESAKYQSACRQQESMQVKQRSLLEQVDALDQECEKLQVQLNEGEDRQTDLQNQLKHISEQREKLQAQLIQQQAKFSEAQEQKQRMETHIGELKDIVTQLRLEVQELAQRERLLVAFPELNPLPQPPPQSTGNVLGDMEQQLQANCVRIKILERENNTLHRSVMKLQARSQHGASETTSPEQPGNGCLSHIPNENQQSPTACEQQSSLQNTSTQMWKNEPSRKGAKDTCVTVGPWDLESINSLPYSASSSTPSLQLHQQTLKLSPNSSAAKTYSKIRQASQARSNTTHPRRK